VLARAGFASGVFGVWSVFAVAPQRLGHGALLIATLASLSALSALALLLAIRGHLLRTRFSPVYCLVVGIPCAAGLGYWSLDHEPWLEATRGNAWIAWAFTLAAGAGELCFLVFGVAAVVGLVNARRRKALAPARLAERLPRRQRVGVLLVVVPSSFVIGAWILPGDDWARWAYGLNWFGLLFGPAIGACATVALLATTVRWTEDSERWLTSGVRLAAGLTGLGVLGAAWNGAFYESVVALPWRYSLERMLLFPWLGLGLLAALVVAGLALLASDGRRTSTVEFDLGPSAASVTDWLEHGDAQPSARSNEGRLHPTP
jgi:hypothetical protein